MRAVIYARYSSELQSDASIEDQVRLCRERIASEGGTVAEVYSDHAISGASMMRPGLQALMQDGAAGPGRCGLCRGTGPAEPGPGGHCRHPQAAELCRCPHCNALRRRDRGSFISASWA